MIQANELRIGNIVSDEDLQPMYIGGIWPVNNSKQYNWIDSAGNTGDVKSLSGIPLSEEILLKCGFELISKIHPFYRLINYKFLMIELSVLKRDYTVRFYINKNESVELTKIKHLHELQNIVHIITKKELNITL